MRKNAFGDYLIYENGENKGYTLKILGSYRVFNNEGIIIGYILKGDRDCFSYDMMDNYLGKGDFETLVFDFFKQKKG